MKFLVLAACVAAASAQGFYGLQSLPNGAVVPIDEPAVAAARADHLAAKAAVYGAAAPVAIAASPVAAYSAAPAIAAAPVSYAAAPAIAAAPVSYAAAPAIAPVAYSAGYSYAPAYGYQGPLNLNTQLIAHPNGAVVPVDEPAVAAARADHLVAKGQAYAAAAPVVAQVAYTAAPVAQVAYAAAPVAAPVAPIAAPVATYGYAGPLNLNTQLVAHPNGAVVPVDEPAVAAARADHLATKGVYGGVYANAGPAVYAAGYAGLQSFPNGAVVPVDEPAVAAARADHFAALAAAY